MNQRIHVFEASKTLENLSKGLCLNCAYAAELYQELVDVYYLRVDSISRNEIAQSVLLIGGVLFKALDIEAGSDWIDCFLTSILGLHDSADKIKSVVSKKIFLNDYLDEKLYENPHISRLRTNAIRWLGLFVCCVDFLELTDTFEEEG